MTRHFLVGAALLLSATTAGLAITAAARESGFLTPNRHAQSTISKAAGEGDRPILLASESRKNGHHAGRIAKRDRHHDDDDDDDEDGSRGMILQNGPASSATPVPGSGLFNGNSRPKVQVQ